MKLGISFTPAHRAPEEWADALCRMGAEAASFPVDYTAPVPLIDAYAQAARARGIVIAEVGAWCSPFLPDPALAQRAQTRCEEQLRLADYVGARCCVNVSGGVGERWDGCAREQFTRTHYDRVVKWTQALLDKVNPRNTFFTLEPMQWMPPDSPEQYQRLIRDIDRPSFAVHLDAVNFIKDPYEYTHIPELLARCFSLLGGSIRSCHIKDCALAKGSTVVIQEVQPGEGVMCLKEYFEAIAALPGDIPALIEHLPDQAAYQKALDTCRPLLRKSEDKP